MLERLDKIDGVQESAANYAGTMIRISVVPAADREKVAGVVEKYLTAENRTVVRLKGAELTTALRQEHWRVKERIGELSAIEFRTFALDRVKRFAENEKLTEETAGKLTELAEKEWDRLAGSTGTKAVAQPQRTDWRGRFRQFPQLLDERTKDLLTEAQRERLRQALTARP